MAIGVIFLVVGLCLPTDSGIRIVFLFAGPLAIVDAVLLFWLLRRR